MKVILLAAGIGTRLLPITESLPKSMIEIAGKPILEYILDDLIISGFDDFCIVVGHHANQIKNYFKNWNKSGIKITFVTQNSLSGTADAVNCAKNFVHNEKFLVYLSDTLIPNLPNILKMIKNNDGDVSLISSQNYSNPSNSIGNIVTSDNIVTHISEKSNISNSVLAWAGIASFNDNSIFKIIKKLNLSKTGEYDITEALNLMLKNEKTIQNFTCDKFIDCGTLDGLLNGLSFIISKISNDSKIQNLSYVSNDCILGTNVTIEQNVSIGKNCSIGNNVSLSDCIILSNTSIGNDKKIKHKVIGGAKILNDCS
ncbi:sugar phosphate nucleotidyltransferase [Nitrosopumilus sp.]|jgi:UDP-N-acetylglucosamine diphosphorylase / glucose-1-phosphate thymidylyltransferase / UDP-N-acetylgalactosamine diphosphorylase / glucosamine-1-phosphate N-acetyltransferase / galactosamine-1-phosphate N-acetyltransferase|nr:sugar phosphate nucleotidyltransferase [Nitrosopumilus sp.]